MVMVTRCMAVSRCAAAIISWTRRGRADSFASAKQSGTAMTDQSRADIYGSRARIGYTSPPLTTEVFPYEFYKMVPAGVTLVVTTLAIVVRSKDEVDQSYDISMKAAREMAAAGVRHRRARGRADQSVARQRQCRADDPRSRGRAEGEGLDQRLGAGAAAKALGCKKVVVAQPYDKTDTDRIASYAQHFGCEVLGATGWGSPFNQIGRIPRHAAIEMGRALMREHPDADSILFPSPHWPTAGALECWSASSASTAWRRIRPSSGMRCAAAASRTGSRDSAGCSGSSAFPDRWRAQDGMKRETQCSKRSFLRCRCLAMLRRRGWHWRRQAPPADPASRPAFPIR